MTYRLDILSNAMSSQNTFQQSQEIKRDILFQCLERVICMTNKWVKLKLSQFLDLCKCEMNLIHLR